jgi:hypothetical protein
VFPAGRQTVGSALGEVSPECFQTVDRQKVRALGEVSPECFQPVDRQKVRALGEGQCLDEVVDIGSTVQQDVNTVTQFIQLGLEIKQHTSETLLQAILLLLASAHNLPKKYIYQRLLNVGEILKH